MKPGYSSVDSDCLVVAETANKYYQAISHNVGAIGNIYMLFMHDLIAHFTGILIHRKAIETYPDLVSFPWVNKPYSHSPFLFQFEEFGENNYRRGFKSRLRGLPLSRVALGEALPFSPRHERVYGNLINLLGSYKPMAQAYLPHCEDQIEDLMGFVRELCTTFEIPNIEIVEKNWLRYVTSNTTINELALFGESILVGSRNNLQNRKLAINYLLQDKEVVAMTHGEVANSVMDEPPFGYSERTLCTTLIDYGDFDADGQFNSPLILPKRRYYRSSSVAVHMYQRANEILVVPRSCCKALYIPTSYAGNKLYGPFHVYEDSRYRCWQKELFLNLPGLTFKTHPKSLSIPPPGIAVECRQLEDCIRDYDLLVIDYFATGSMLALISDKPVIYFDIGLRRLQSEFERDVKNRCEYARIDISDRLGDQIEAALERFWSVAEPQDNTTMARYSICGQSDCDWRMGLQFFSGRKAPSLRDSYVDK